MPPTAPLAVIRTPGSAAAALDPIRQQVLAHLVEPDSATGVARRLDLPRQKVNYHLRALEEAGLVELVEERRKGNCIERLVRASARAYVISPETLGAVAPGADLPADRLSSAYLIAVAGRTIRELAELDARAAKAGKRVATLTLDAEIRFASAAARAEFAEELGHAVARLAARYHDDRAPGGRAFRLVAAVHPAVPAAGAAG